MRTPIGSLRPGRVGAGLAAVVLAAVLSGCGERPTAAGYDLVLVSLDTLRADRLGCYGYRAAATPALDRLAAEGARFADVTAPAPLTLPSHATLLSGRLPPRHGLRHNGLGRFPDGVDTLATRLAAAGYRTAAFVGAFVLDRRFGLGRGFELYDDRIERPAAGGTPRLEAERPAAAVIDRAVAWLEQAGGERPLFLWVHLYDAHAPYAAPEPWGTRFADRPYDGEIAYVDAQIDRLLAALGRRGRAERTVVAVVGDHGEALGEHGERSHGLLLYEAALAVPWILAAPGVVDAGRTVSTPVGLADVAPTLAGLLGLEPAAAGELDGRDLSPALRGGGEPAAAALYAETEYPALFGWAGLAALRRGPLKLIAAPRPELYDVVADPAESRNLVAERRREFRELMTRLEEIRAEDAAPEGGAAVDAETRERLAALGYAGGVPARPPAAGADPKDRVELFTAYEDARRVLERGDPEAAAGELERLVAADPANPVFRGALALAYRRAGDLERAIVHYREAAAAAPHDPDAWQNLAAALREAGRPRQALAAAKEALSRGPERAEARNLLGLAYLAEGAPEEARRELERALELDPENAAVWNNLGNVLRALGEAAAAEDAYRRAAELAPRFADPLNGLGTLLVELDRPRDALALFDRVLELEPGLHEARLNRGIALELAGDREGAAAAYRDFLARTGGDPKFLRQREAAGALLARISD